MTCPDPLAELLRRIDRLESIDQIRQLAAKYSLALDMRDMDAMAGLFPEDIRVGENLNGREALRQWLDQTMRQQFTGTAHHIGNHIVEFDDVDHAHGIVYSKNEHETPEQWVIMQMLYADDYERIRGLWYFRRRLPLYWYATDLNSPPLGAKKMRWPGVEPYEGGFHGLFPSWREFWQRSADVGGPVPEPAPLEGFIERMRRGAPAPAVKVR